MKRKIFALAILLHLASLANAGGPAYVAGASFFDPSTVGSPLIWAQGTLSYYTDQGDLSAVLPGASADTFVANAFALWTAIPTAALSATHSGQLAEDVTGVNLTVATGVITTPADIAPTATATPIGIVYDQDGSVTDDLLGAGASNSAECGFRRNRQFRYERPVSACAHCAERQLRAECFATAGLAVSPGTGYWPRPRTRLVTSQP